MTKYSKSFILLIGIYFISVLTVKAQEKPKPFEYAKLFTEAELKKERLYSNLGASTIKKYKEVYKLRLSSGRSIHGKVDAVPGFVDTLKNLQYLYVRSEALQDLPNTLKDCKNMQFLHLSNNRFKKIPEVIFTFKHLKLLDLRANRFKEITPEIGNLTELEYLYVGQNADLRIVYLDAIKKLTNLKVLDLTGTKVPIEQARKMKEIVPKGCKVLHD